MEAQQEAKGIHATCMAAAILQVAHWESLSGMTLMTKPQRAS